MEVKGAASLFLGRGAGDGRQNLRRVGVVFVPGLGLPNKVTESISYDRSLPRESARSERGTSGWIDCFRPAVPGQDYARAPAMMRSAEATMTLTEDNAKSSSA